MAKSLTQEEIDNLIRIFKESGNINNDIDADFVIELLKDNLLFYENKKTELLITIERDYEPKIDSLKKAISVLQK